jgi:hypothetical protein
MRPEGTRLCDAEGGELDDADARLDLDLVQDFLARSYWSAGILRKSVARAVGAIWSFGRSAPSGAQIGCARRVADHAAFANLAGVFALEDRRRRALPAWMVGEICALATLRGLRRILLATGDADGLYAKAGFGPLGNPLVFMAINRPEIHGKAAA